MLLRCKGICQTRKTPLHRGVRQADVISPKLFTIPLEEIFKAKLEQAGHQYKRRFHLALMVCR